MFKSKPLLISFYLCSLVLLPIISLTQSSGQSHTDLIIEKIKTLESQKDAKCHATANRLEDFIYGSPLTESARNRRIEIQKTFIEHIKISGSQLAKKDQVDSIFLKQIQPVLEGIITFGRLADGTWFIDRPSERLLIKSIDFDQYSSVSYAYRSLLSVEQDFSIFNMVDNLPLSKETIEPLYMVANLITLGTLQLADQKCRAENRNMISEDDISEAWINLLEDSKNLKKAKPTVNNTLSNQPDFLISQIIKQKMESYENYNSKISTSVFLRNIQVYFAKQKWPTNNETSQQLKSFYLESLIAFAQALINESTKNAQKEASPIIRINHVQKALNAFTPFTANMFEDICFFPKLNEKSITIESYDLDAFRDSGWHWQILSYAIGDNTENTNFHIDPNGAELIVEGIAQLAVLVFRIAGQNSHLHNKEVLDIEDITQAFTQIQSLITEYSNIETIDQKIPSLKTQATSIEAASKGFVDCTNETGLDFYHKSSDWLSRFIRSYVFNKETNTAKIGVPPAFGGSGVATEDIDNDGDIDLLILSGLGNVLYINNGKGQFEKSKHTEVFNIWNQELQSYAEPRQPVIADFNNDGWQDVFITFVNDNHLIIQNKEGRHFQKLNTNLGGKGQVGGPATVFDFNNDGLLDIFIGYFGNYLKGNLPTLGRYDQNGDANKLFINRGNFVFEETSFDHVKNAGWTQALGHTDINQDGYQDIIVGNDFGTNEYYINNGDGSFTEKSQELGTDKPSYSMNVGIADINGDLYPDIYISNIVVMQKEEKYVNPNATTEMKFDLNKMAQLRTVEANDLFVSNVHNQEMVSFNSYEKMGRGYTSTGWSWDADFFDYDNDGDNDLYCLNGMNDFSVYSQENNYFPIDSAGLMKTSFAQSHREKNVFFTNHEGQFNNEATSLGLDVVTNSRSASYFDFDQDGDLDIVTNNYHDQATIHKNLLGQDNNWIKVKLIGAPDAKVNKDAIGAVIIANSKYYKNQWREIHSTDGYLSSHPKIQHIGLGKDEYVDLIVHWPNGKQSTFKKIKSNQTYKISYPNTISKIE